MEVQARLSLLSGGTEFDVVSVRFIGSRAESEEAEKTISFLAPSCEFDYQARCWKFPLRYFKDVVSVIRKHVCEIKASPKLAAAYRAQQRSDEFVLSVKSKPFDTFPDAPYRLIFNPEFIPRPYQCQGITVMLAARNLLLGDAVGLGKTIQSVGAIALAMNKGACKRAMVVTLSSLKGQWCDEAESYLRPDVLDGLASSFVAVRGDKAKRTKIYRDPSVRVFVVNYELFLYDLAAMPGVDMIILDEAARIKSISAKTPKIIKQYCAKHGVRYRYALTATAIETKLEDLYSILSFLCDKSLGFYTYFLYHYCKLHRFRAPNGRQVRKIVGHLNLGEAKRRTDHVLLRRTKDDVGVELPELVVRNVVVDLNIRQRELYDEIKAKAIQGQIDPLQCSLLLRELCDSLELVDGSGSMGGAKLDELEHIIRESLGPDHSVVIFSQWKRMAHIIAKRLSKCYEKPPRIISGGVNEKDRDKHRRDFSDQKFRCLIMTDAGKAGLNLQACETMINFELPWNPATLKQRIGRMHRSGQEHKVTTVINLIANNTIEQSVADRLMRRHRVFDKVLTAAADELQAMDLSSTLTSAELMELI